MKKNAMMKIAAILMVAVLLTTCAISSTFAKYVTSDSDTTTAQVAKWGVTVDTSLAGLFATSYNDTNDKVVVKSASQVVAPGTSGELEGAVTITGTPEVAVKLTTAAVIALEGWGDVCPLVFKLNGVDYTQAVDNPETTDKDESETVAAFATRMSEALTAAGTYLYDADPNANLADTYDIDIKWSWAFDGDDDIDTALGNMAAGIDAEGNSITPAPATVTVTFTQSVEQINPINGATVN